MKIRASFLLNLMHLKVKLSISHKEEQNNQQKLQSKKCILRVPHFTDFKYFEKINHVSSQQI